MPGMGGLEATRKIIESHTRSKIIILTIHTETTFSVKMMQAGAFGYLTKGTCTKEMVNAIHKVHLWAAVHSGGYRSI